MSLHAILGVVMKLFLCVIIVFFSGCIGIAVKSSYNKKFQFYSEIDTFLHFISIKIAFFRDIYAECVDSFMGNNQLINKKFFKNFKQLLIDGNFNKNEFFKIIDISLTDKEKEELFNILYSIGSTDIDNQNNILVGSKKQIENKVEELAKLKKTKGDVIAKLSICVGIVICILIY